MSAFASARTVAALPITGRPSSCSPNTQRAARSCTRSDGSSSIIAISSSTTSRSDSSASASKRGRAAMSHITSSASGRCSSSTRTWKTVDSRVVNAFSSEPRRSETRAIATWSKRSLPLNSRCSMRWVTPASAGRSSRAPTPTNTPTATERTPAIFSQMTRRPSGNVVS